MSNHIIFVGNMPLYSYRHRILNPFPWSPPTSWGRIFSKCSMSTWSQSSDSACFRDLTAASGNIKNLVSITLIYKAVVILVSYLGQIFGASLPWALQHLHLLQQRGRINKRLTILFRVIFNQLTSSFVLLEKVCQEFAHCLLWHKHIRF